MPSLLQRNLIDYLTPVEFEPGKHVFRNIDPRTQFGWVVGGDDEPERVVGPRVLVPVHDWRQKDEQALIAGCLARAAEANPIKATNFRSLGEGGFWQRVPTPRALVVHPMMLGRFHQPGLKTMAFETVPENRVIVLRQPDLVGFFIKQEHRRGFLAHDRQGLFSIGFQTP